MAKLGYLGLGIMGYPMARNLCRAGHSVSVWSHTAAKAERLAREEGAAACKTAAEVAASADCVFVCVGDTKMSEETILGSAGAADGLRPGAVVVDASTISASASLRIADQLAARDIRYLDAPCTGSKLGAEGGTLTFMVGGHPDDFARVRPYFEVVGGQVYYCGSQGMGLRVKLAQNLIQSNILQAFNEGMVLATKAGVPPELMLEIINNTAARSNLIAFKAPYVLRRDFSTHFSLKWMHKDIGLALQLAEESGVPVPITGLTYQLFQAAIAQGCGEEDFCSSIKLLEGLAGVEVHENPES